VIPILAAASVVGLIVGTVGLARLASAPVSVRPLAATASPIASSGPARLAQSPQPLAGGSSATTTTGAPEPSRSPGPALSLIAGHYLGSTGSSGQLFIRSDGAARFTGLDFTACPSCFTASAPSETIDFGLTTLTVVKRLGEYVAEGLITAESDPADALKLAGPVGAKVQVTIVPGGNLRLSFLPDTDVLRKAAQG